MCSAVYAMTSYKFCPIRWFTSRKKNTKHAYIKYLIIEASEPIHTYKIIILRTIV